MRANTKTGANDSRRKPRSLHGEEAVARAADRISIGLRLLHLNQQPFAALPVVRPDGRLIEREYARGRRRTQTRCTATVQT